jgi:hypothetical protein
VVYKYTLMVCVQFKLIEQYIECEKEEKNLSIKSMWFALEIDQYLSDLWTK